MCLPCRSSHRTSALVGVLGYVLAAKSATTPPDAQGPPKGRTAALVDTLLALTPRKKIPMDDPGRALLSGLRAEQVRDDRGAPSPKVGPPLPVKERRDVDVELKVTERELLHVQ